MDIYEIFEDKNKLGFGSLRFPKNKDGNVDTALVSDMFDRYLCGGGKYFEAAYNYYQAEATIKKCLVDRYPRSDYLLADKMPVNEVRTNGEYSRIFSEQIKKCGVDYFDFYLLHSVSYKTYLQTEKLGGFEFIKDLKERKLARWIGFSFHDSAEVLGEILEKYHEIFDFVQLQINYLDWESPVIQSRKCYDVAQKYNLPIFVMEPNKGGRLINLPNEAISIIQTVDADLSAASCALRWVASKKQIACVLSGMNSVEQVESNLASLQTPIVLSEKSNPTNSDYFEF